MSNLNLKLQCRTINKISTVYTLYTMLTRACEFKAVIVLSVVLGVLIVSIIVISAAHYGSKTGEGGTGKGIIIL